MSAKQRDDEGARERDVDAAMTKLDDWQMGRVQLDDEQQIVAVVRLQIEEIRLLREIRDLLRAVRS